MDRSRFGSEADFKLAFCVVGRKTARSFMEQNIEETPALFNAMAWIEKNKKLVIAGVVGVIIAVAIYASIISSRNEKREQAGQALSHALLSPSFNRTSQAEVAPGLLKVADVFSDTPAGEQALLLAGGSFFNAGKFTEAQSAFERFNREHSGSELAPQAMYGVAAALSAQGKSDEAGKSYKEIVDRHPNSAVAMQARYSLASILTAQGKLEQAAVLYEEVARGDSGGSLGNEASLRADELHAKLPAAPAPVPVAATNAPVAK